MADSKISELPALGDTPAGSSELPVAQGGTTVKVTVTELMAAAGAAGAPTDASYLVLGANATLTDERVLTAGSSIAFVDSGAGNALTINYSGVASGGHTIQDEGTPLTARTNLNFIGSAVTVTDNSGSDATDVTITGGSGTSIGANAIINGDMRISQRGTTFTSATTPANSDDKYLLDRWNLLSDGNDIVDVSQSTVAPTGFSNSIKLEVETANKQFGILTILENKDSIPLVGGTASLSFYARMAAADDNTHSLKAAVLSWDSTADTVTSDVVGTWGASVTLATNWTAENTPASNTLTTSWQRFTIENIAIDTASAANVAVLFYCDQTDGVVDDAIYITGVKLEKGATATDYVARPIADELSLCMRYFENMKADGGVYTYFLPGMIQSAGNIGMAVWKFTIPKHHAPTVSFSGATDFQLDYAAANPVTTAMTADMTGLSSTRVYGTVASAPAGNPAFMLRANNTTAAFLAATAEL